MNKKLFFVLFLVLGLAGCNLPGTGSNAGTNAQDLVATRVEATQQALQASAQPEDSQPDEEPQATEPDGLLPHTLYYLSSADGEIFQVWMLDRDGLSNTRVTSEPNGVDEYSVSPADGRVAFITNNQIYIINPSGDQRQLLVDGSSSIAESDEYFYTQRINGLSWSPDGGSLAYGRNGLHIYHFETQTDEHVLPNEIEERDSGFLFPQALYSPYQWSPDGSQLLVNISYYEAGTLGIYTPGSPEIEKLGDRIICCQPTWSPDSRSIVVASPFLGYIDSGLWRIDTITGKATELIPATSPDETLNFAGWPVVLDNGDLRYFYTNTPSFPTGDVPLLMVNSASDGVSGRTILRLENWLNYEVLWAENGTLALAVQPITGEDAGWPRTGPIVLIPPSEDPVIPLGINGYQLQWGP
jgi:hypothetical protein